MLYPSPQLKKILNNYKKLSNEEQMQLIDDYLYGDHRTSERAATKLINSLSHLFADLITKNSRKFERFASQWTFDDIFDEMTLAFLKSLKRYNKNTSNLTTWATQVVKPIINNAESILGNKHKGGKQFISINEPDIYDFIQDKGQDILQKYKDEQQKNRIRDAIDKLPKDEREIIENFFGFVEPPKRWLNKYGKVSTIAMAKDLGVHPETIRTKIKRALAKLSRYLRQEQQKETLYKKSRGR